MMWPVVATVLAAVKGSPDGLVKLATHVLDQGCIVPLTDDARRLFHDANERLANDGIRVLVQGVKAGGDVLDVDQLAFGRGRDVR